MTKSTSPGERRTFRRRLIYRGAEADVVRGEWQGLDAVYKVRKPLGYRLKALDDAIRRQRTQREAEMIHRAKGAGVPAPYLFEVDVPGSTLVMEYVQGTRLKDLIQQPEDGDIERYFHEFGRLTGLLHASGIMHGDLTSANVVVRDRELVLIDFGLSVRSSRLEDHAVDLRLIKETLVGAHPEVSAAAFGSLVAGYREARGRARTRSVLGQLRSVERRGRYARVV